MKDKQIISVRSNCDFSLNYETGKLHPCGEIIILTTAPKYEITKKQDSIVKGVELEEFRFKGSLKSVNELIGQLQLLVQSMNTFEQMAAAFNTIITSSKEKETKESDPV